MRYKARFTVDAIVMANVEIVVTGAVVAGVAGVAAGSFGRRLLSAVPRGVALPAWWCEAGVALLWTFVTGRVLLGSTPLSWACVPLTVGWLAVVLSACDLRVHRLPDAVTLPAYPAVLLAVGLASLGTGIETMLASALCGGVLYAGCYACVRLVTTRAMGAGDVKLAGSIGIAAGAVSLTAVLTVILVAAVLTLISAMGKGAALSRNAAGFVRQPIPHGPAMLIPAWLVTAFPAMVPTVL